MYLCWGEGSRQQRRGPAGSQLLQAASGERHSLLLFSDHTVHSCGDNGCGQLGRRRVQSVRQPEQIQALETLRIELVSCGKDYSLAVCHKGRVFAWGAGSEGQLGIGEFKEINFTPKKINALAGIKIIQVSCGHYHSLALSEDGQVFSWGKNSQGQLGLGKEFPSQATPQRVRSLEGIPLAQVAAGGAHSFALSLLGTSFGWGSNNAGQLALTGNDIPVQIYKPHSIGALKSLGVIYISCGYEHTAVLTQDGQLFTFGDNSSGQLGHSTSNERRGPQRVERIDSFISQIDCGSYHTMAYVCTTGQVLSFGCGPSHINNLTPQEASTEKPDVTCLLPTDDLMDIQVKYIFAGTFANFVTTCERTSSASVSKKILPEMSRINLSLVEKWIAMKRSSDEYEVTTRKISTIFSSPACLTASFLKKRDADEKIPIDVDLKMARDVFTKLTKVTWISSLITTCLENLLKALPCRSPHQEALSIFLLLPECPVMRDPKNRRTLTVEFANAVCGMSKRSLGVLKKCWASLEASSLNILVEMLKTAVVSQMCDETTDFESNLKTLLGMMKEIHEVNKANCQLPESTFYINEFTFLLDCIEKRRNLILRENNPIPAEFKFVIFRDFPFIFSPMFKLYLMQCASRVNVQPGDIMSQGNNELVTFTLRVRRSHLVEDAMRQLSQAEVSDLRKPLLVEFINEIRAERGGVHLEFFRCIFEEMTHPKYEMFFYPENGSYMWFPVNPKFEKKRYFLFGILCGLSLFNLNAVGLPFPLGLYKKLLDQKPSLDDLKELSFLWGKNLQEILNYEDDVIKDLHMYFSIYWDQNDIDLIPNGISKPVDQTNKKDYVSKCVDYIFNISVKTVYEEFQRGFYKVCDRDIIRHFSPEELRTAIIGRTNYDWEQFENNSRYEQGYDKSHPTILLFWKAFHKLTLDKKKKFLIFLTGSDRLHVGGLQYEGIEFRCPVTLTEKDPPRSVTCHNILYLPKYSTMKRMKEALRVAINSNKGFMSPPGGWEEV